MVLFHLRAAAALVLTTAALSFAAYDYSDSVAASATHPGTIGIDSVPMFISIGFDDNKYADGTEWIRSFMFRRRNPQGSGNPATFDNTPARTSFYLISNPGIGNYALSTAWKNLYYDGHELGAHTINHDMGWMKDSIDFTVEQWTTSIKGSRDFIIDSLGIPANDVWGFRTPYLAYNNNTFKVVKQLGFVYDCSIEEGIQPDQDGSNFNWPYTLDNGSQAANQSAADSTHAPVDSSHKGLWEMPAYMVIIPPDSVCADYDIPVGLRDSIFDRIKRSQSWDWDKASGKFTGLDYNLWFDCNLTEGQFLAILKYNLDIHLAGNRAPFLFGTHSDYYSQLYTAEPAGCVTTYLTRRTAIEEFIDYALTKPAVRIVRPRDIISWMRQPAALGSAAPGGPFTLTALADNGTVTVTPVKETYAAGDTVVLSASASDNYLFSRWAGSVADTTAQVKVVMNRDLTVRAVFLMAAMPFDTTDASNNLVPTVLWEPAVDEYGSTYSPQDNFVNSEGELKMTFFQTAKTGADIWPWVELVANIGKPLIDLHGMKITYKCTKQMAISLVQSTFNSDESYAHYQHILPATDTWTTVQIMTSQFAQPDWTPSASKLPLDLTKVQTLAFIPVINEAGDTGIIELKDVVLYGVKTLDVRSVTSATRALCSIDMARPGQIRFSVPFDGEWTMKLLTMDGREVAEPVRGFHARGQHSALFDTGKLAAGLYLVSLRSKKFQTVGRISIIGKK